MQIESEMSRYLYVLDRHWWWIKESWSSRKGFHSKTKKHIFDTKEPKKKTQLG